MKRLALIAVLLLAVLFSGPAAAQVNGVAVNASKGAVLLGSPAGVANCTAATTGAIRYNSTTPRIEFCDGTSWQGLAGEYIGGLSLTGKASCNWTITTSWAGMAANANCNTLTADGSATSPGKYPAITFASLTAGTYRVTFNIPYDNSAGCAFRISDGTNTAGIAHVISTTGDYVSGIFTYASTQANITFSLQGKSSSSSSCTVYGDAATSGLLVTDFVSKFYVEKL